MRYAAQSALDPIIARLIVENLSTAVLLFDADLRLQLINTAAEHLLSVSARKVLGLRVEDFFVDSALATAIHQALESGRSVTEWDLRLETPWRAALYVDCTLSPTVEGRTGTQVLVEMTSSARHRRALQEEVISVQESAIRNLFKGMAHEVKNPLGGIRGAAQLLERELRNPSYREYTRLIVEEVDRLRTLIDRMLIANAAEHKNWINIHEVLEHVRALVEAEAPGDFTVTRDYDPSLPELYADRDQLIQAFLNVARNALQAVAGRGGVEFRTRVERQVTLGLRRHKLAIRVDILDDGPGVPNAIAQEIFVPMVTGRAEGSGLGLSIARTLIHGHHGHIEFTSRPGNTVFSIWLPAHNES